MVIHFPHSPQRFKLFSGRIQGFRKTQLSFLKTVIEVYLEDVFCSKTRMKILKTLFQCGQLNTSDIANRLGTNYDTALRNLILLENEGIVLHKVSGRIRFFRFSNTIKSKAVIELLEEWDKR